MSYSFKQHSEVSSLGGLVAWDTTISRASGEPGKQELKGGKKVNKVMSNSYRSLKCVH